MHIEQALAGYTDDLICHCDDDNAMAPQKEEVSR
jgi:hypothetical protein